MRLLALVLLLSLSPQISMALNCQGAFLAGANETGSSISDLLTKLDHRQDADSAANSSKAKALGLEVEDAEDMDLEVVLGEKAFYQITADLDNEGNFFPPAFEVMSYVVKNSSGLVVGLIHQVAQNLGSPAQRSIRMSQMYYQINTDGSAQYVGTNGPIVMDRVAKLVKMSDDPDADEVVEALKKRSLLIEDAEDIQIHKLMSKEAMNNFAREYDYLEERFSAGKPFPYEEMVYIVLNTKGVLVGAVLQFTQVGGPGHKKMQAFISIDGDQVRTNAKATASFK